MKKATQPLGELIRQFRIEKGLTLRELASLIGKSESYLSRVENGKTNPSLSSLKRLGDALGRPLVHFFESPAPVQEAVTAEGEQRQLVVSSALEYDLLSAPNPHIAMFKMRLKKRGSSGPTPYAHPGIETGLVLSGKAKIVVGDREYILQAGDSITYRSDQPHRFENVGDEDAVGIWAVSPPTF